MGKTVVIYSTKYGSTARYAGLLAESLECDLFECSELKLDELLEYDNIIFGGAVYAGRISNVEVISKHFESLKDKNIVVFAVGISDPEIESQFEPMISRTFTPEIRETIKIFHLRGDINYNKLGFLHKLTMWMMIRSLKKIPKDKLSEEQKLLIDTYGKEVKFLDEESIEPIVKHIKKIGN